MAFHIAKIIGKYLTGGISEEERKELDKWLSEDTEHHRLLDEFKRSGFIDDQLKSHYIFEVEKGYRKFLKWKRATERRRTIGARIAVAAAIALPLIAASIWFFYLHTKETPSRIPMADIKPGISHATLILADGQQIELTDSVFFNVNQETGKTIIQGAEINYLPENRTDTLVYNTLSTPRGGEYRLILADGTRVWVGAATEFKYPVAFTGNTREVQITGEAYFEVAKDSARPFIVKTEYMDVKVLGTSFNIRAYRDETEQATLVEGRIEVASGDLKQLLIPGDQLNVQHNVFEMRKVKVQSYIAWKNQRFIFSDEPLEEVLRKLERWYDIPFVINHPVLKQLRFTGSVPKYENLDGVLKKLELTTCIHFVQKAGTVFVVQDR